MKKRPDLSRNDSAELLRLYQDLVETSQDLMWQCDAEGRYTYLNPAWEPLLGYTLEEMMGRKFTDFQPPDIAEHDLKELGRLLEGGTVKGYETVHLSKSGEEIFIAFNAKSFCDEKGCIAGARGTAFDVTERKRMENALRESEERFRTLFMSITDGFYLSEVICDENGIPFDYRYVEVNSAFEKMLGLQREQIVGRRYREIVPEDTTKWLDNYFHVARTSLPCTYEFYSNEYKMYFETYSYKTANDRIAVFVRDVTARKNTEKALQNMQKLESLGVLAGGIAHDFNNLLGGIFGYIDLALEELEGHRAAQHLSFAMSGIDRARNLTQQLLTFSKGGAPEMKKGALFPFVLETAKFALSGSNVSVNCRVPENLWKCEFDRNQLGRVVDNIVINAQQAMPDGGTIRIRARNEQLAHGAHPTLPQGSYVRISIEDSGIGMTKEMTARIFDPFYSTKTKGHGLGLTVCYSIVNQHRGVIEVESEPGRGTTFHLLLPSHPGVSTAAPPSFSLRHSGRGTVLVMDDEVLMQRTVTRMVESYGYKVLCASDGDEAISMFRQEISRGQDIAFMIVDLTVPGGRGGKDIIDEVRKLRPQMPVFVISGYGEDPVMARPEKFGFTASLGKPFRKSELTEVLETYLNVGGGAPAHALYY